MPNALDRLWDGRRPEKNTAEREMLQLGLDPARSSVPRVAETPIPRLHGLRGTNLRPVVESGSPPVLRQTEVVLRLLEDLACGIALRPYCVTGTECRCLREGDDSSRAHDGILHLACLVRERDRLFIVPGLLQGDRQLGRQTRAAHVPGRQERSGTTEQR